MPAIALEARRSASAWRIRGGVPLDGVVTVSGAKNAALPILAASLLADGPVCLDRIPAVADVTTLVAVLQSVGSQVTRARDRLTACVVDPDAACASLRLVRRMRASFCVLGPLLARRGRATVALPGGCRIGPRPVDIHLRGLAALGADLRLVRGAVVAEARRLNGSRIDLAGPYGPSVTGTANVLCAATLARGGSLLTGAAQEPEIVDLGQFLISLGARIDGLGTPRLEVQGVERLVQPVDQAYRVIPDRIEAATWLIAAAITGGRIAVRGAAPADLSAVCHHLRQAGVQIDAAADGVIATAPDSLRAIDYTARPYPGLPTDVQPLWAALMTQARGASRLGDEVFPSRFGYLDELARLGANFAMGSGGCTVWGGRPLTGAAVTATDLRGGAALLLAGLAAIGETTLAGTRHLARGYTDLAEKLQRLGARIS